MQLGSRPPQPAAAAADAQAAADEAEAANAEEQSGGRPPEILEEFSNFTADPPGHKSGFVTIIGRPNAGKSTLMNALLHQTLSIVTPRAQTTRHRVLGLLSEPGYQAVFLDTPGIITDKRNKLEDKMMAAVQQVRGACSRAWTCSAVLC
jgi:GTP-binding protein Era